MSFYCDKCGLSCKHLKDVVGMEFFDRRDGVCRFLDKVRRLSCQACTRYPDEEKSTGLSISRDVYDEAVKMLGEKSQKSREQFITPAIAAALCMQGRMSGTKR